MTRAFSAMANPAFRTTRWIASIGAQK